MKKALNIISLIVISATVIWLWALYTPTNEATRQTGGRLAEPLDTPTVEFKRFAPDEKVVVDFEEGHDILEPLSPREQMDQVKDWLIYTILSESGLPAEKISRIVYDLPPVRHGYIEPVANFEYGETRSLLIGEGLIIALVPAFKKDGDSVPESALRDYLAHIADEHRKNVGEKPSRMILFRYEIDLDEQFALVWRQQNLDCTEFFTEAYGYFESKIRDLAGFQHFMEKIDDITFARLNFDKLIIGGRKLQDGRYGGIRVEDVAAIWQSESKINERIEQFNDYWQRQVDLFNARWAGKSYSRYSNRRNPNWRFDNGLNKLAESLSRAQRYKALGRAENNTPYDPLRRYHNRRPLFGSFDSVKALHESEWEERVLPRSQI